MSFREKSAWAMGAVMLGTGLLLAWLVLQVPAGSPPQMLLVPLVPYVLTVIICSIIVQALLGIFTPREAQRGADERERVAIDRAGHWSGYVLGFVVVAGALHYLFHGNGNWLFLCVVGGLILAQLADYACQIWLFRRGA